MSSIFFTLKKLGWAVIVAILLTLFVAGPSLLHANVVRQSEFINWPPELRSRAPALADSIAVHFGGESPRTLTFRGRDTLEVEIWNPPFWRNDVHSKALPMESIPRVIDGAKRVAHVVWTRFGPADGIKIIVVTFVRVRREDYIVTSREIPAQRTFLTFSRPFYERGPHWEPGVGIMQLEGGSWERDP